MFLLQGTCYNTHPCNLGKLNIVKRNNLRNYELTTILDPDIAEEDFSKAMEKLAGLITKNGGKVIETDHWGRRRLSYPIGKHAEGNYVMMKLDIDPDKTDELETDMNISIEYLRHLLLRVGD